MNLTTSDKLAAAGNWIMAVFSVLMAAYVILQMFAPPPQSQALGVVPDPAAAPVQGVTAARGGAEADSAPPQAAAAAAVPEAGPPGPAIQRTSPPKPPAEAGAEPNIDNNAPRAKGSAVPIPPLNPANLPPGVGKDF